ncbi:hypothetical protein KC571_02695 [candidate division WWE3 bacterium]|uniref:Uncharacterized protein n=1 Tax=candidate division WWE3 bacterium TaxID=2053526 RepID=A0A955LGR3_UNCKA|nr:hypothetical protein [candidate division WWE3 bacterium]
MDESINSTENINLEVENNKPSDHQKGSVVIVVVAIIIISLIVVLLWFLNKRNRNEDDIIPTPTPTTAPTVSISPEISTTETPTPTPTLSESEQEIILQAQRTVSEPYDYFKFSLLINNSYSLEYPTVSKDRVEIGNDSFTFAVIAPPPHSGGIPFYSEIPDYESIPNALNLNILRVLQPDSNNITTYSYTTEFKLSGEENCNEESNPEIAACDTRRIKFTNNGLEGNFIAECTVENTENVHYCDELFSSLKIIQKYNIPD